jgi:hypothetical protein
MEADIEESEEDGEGGKRANEVCKGNVLLYIYIQHFLLLNGPALHGTTWRNLLHCFISTTYI